MTETVPPAAWLVDNVDLIPRGGRVLDVASGRGRNARFLAARGFRVHAIDRDPSALGRLLEQVQEARLRGHRSGERRRMQELPVTAELRDLETGDVSLGHRCYDGVIVFNYLHRPLMPAIVDAVGAQGVLIYETFTIGQAERGHPKNPAFLLQPGELETLVAPLRVVRSREGEFDDKLVASVVAIRG